MQARLISWTAIAPDVREFLFEAVGVERLDYVPGQFVSLTSSLAKAEGGETKQITRAYSLASAPEGHNQFALCLNRVEGGWMSPFLFAMQPGETMEMSAPMGTFVLREAHADAPRHSIFIATGTGVAPFRAMLRAMLRATLRDDSSRFTLLLGARYESHLLYRAEFAAFAQQHPQFRFMPTLSRPDADWRGRTGYVQAHLTEALDGIAADAVDFYLCGLGPMVNGVRAILKEMGFNRKQIRSEKYD
ncbi:MAG: FAD-binding oxidoreductase [Acidobacteriota bacterium]